MLHKTINLPKAAQSPTITCKEEPVPEDPPDEIYSSYVDAALRGPYAVPEEALRFLIQNEHRLYNIGFSEAKRKIGEALRVLFARKRNIDEEIRYGKTETNAAALGISLDDPSWSERDLTEAKLRRAEATKAAFKAISAGIARVFGSASADRKTTAEDASTTVRAFKGPFEPIGFHEADDLFVSDRTLRNADYLRSQMNAVVTAAVVRFVRRILGLRPAKPTSQKNIRTAA